MFTFHSGYLEIHNLNPALIRFSATLNEPHTRTVLFHVSAWALLYGIILVKVVLCCISLYVMAQESLKHLPFLSLISLHRRRV